MGEQPKELTGPNLGEGIPLASLEDSVPCVGHANGEAVLIVRRGEQLFALSASCSHYGGPLGDGILVGDTIRCPYHHACFNLKTGEATAAPALTPIASFDVVRIGDRVAVGDRRGSPRRSIPLDHAPSSVVAVGAGPAGAAFVEALRREGYPGPITLIGDEAPVDRPNLSKDYLAGKAPEEWLPIRPTQFYKDMGIDVIEGDDVVKIDAKDKSVSLASGRTLPFGALLFATGAEPVKLTAPGANAAHVFTLRSLADSRAIVARAATAKRVCVIGASFIGLEVAASLTQRGIAVEVVAPEAAPLARVLGEDVGKFIRIVHEKQGTRFHLGRTVKTIKEREVELDDGTKIKTDFVVTGVGVRPRTQLAEAAGVAVDNGVLVDETLRTNVDGIFAAGDVARATFHRTGERIRVEHFVVAERQGQVAARNVMGKRVLWREVPFFWSVHHDVTISYVGHAAKWDSAKVTGDLTKQDATIAYRAGGKIAAVATIGRDKVSLGVEAAMEAGDDDALEALVK